MIAKPDDPELEDLCRELRSRADALDASGAWPAEQLDLCRAAGVNRWFVPSEWGGAGWNEIDLAHGLMRLGAACLSTAFILTQPLGVCRRLLASENETTRRDLLPRLAAGDVFATVGISHLTTSRRHLARPVLAARETDGGFVLDGIIPWVTGAGHADYLLTGATLDDGRQILTMVPTDAAGFVVEPPARLVGLTSTHTGGARCGDVRVEERWVLAGPVENVLSSGGAGTGGAQTSALAVGLATSAIEFLENEAARRDDLASPAGSLRRERQQLESDVLALVGGDRACDTAGAPKADDVRARANSLVLRATQAALAAAKGSGYVLGHPAGRWCREALFFLVWSCPQPVTSAALCELAGLSG